MKQTLLALLLFLLLAALLAACGGASAPATDAAASVDLASLPVDLTVEQVNAIRNHPDVVLIDVREQWEYDEGHIPNIKLVPLGQLPNRLNEIPKDKFVVMTCRSGNRSNQAAQFLRQQGFDNVHNMQGGILAWQQAGLPVEK
ncbi:MAG TPA: rhodanese-like domain-containing protein [Anaerolineae bacterium]|nr:rhodanese-like domain-containing protein [Anaerolineae bacterium]